MTNSDIYIYIYIHFLLDRQFRNLRRHTFKVVTVPHFPFMDYVRENYKPGSIITPIDTIDTRLIVVFAESLNFT